MLPKEGIKYSILFPLILAVIGIHFSGCDSRPANSEIGHGEKVFPVSPEVLVQGQFSSCEGIAFNGEGDLYVAGDRALWRVDTQGRVIWVAEASSNLGLAAIGDHDILLADFGPLNAWDHGYNRDGIVWRVTPEGEKAVAADGLGDPNSILVMADGRFLVSDDATDEIFVVGRDGAVNIFTRQVNHPNGMALSLDGTTLYVAQMFKQINPNVTDGRIWQLPLVDGMIQGAPEVIADLGDGAANDGLAVDRAGCIYIAAWRSGEIWRLDHGTRELTLIAEHMNGVASLAFGRGEHDHQAIYATSTASGVVWKVSVGIEGAPLNR